MGVKEELKQNVAVKDVEDYESGEYEDEVCISIFESAEPVLNGDLTRILHAHDHRIDELYHRPERDIYELYAHS